MTEARVRGGFKSKSTCFSDANTSVFTLLRGVNICIINQRLKNTLELQCCHYYLFGRTGLCAFSSLFFFLSSSLLLSYFLILCTLMCVWTLGYCHCSFTNSDKKKKKNICCLFICLYFQGSKTVKTVWQLQPDVELLVYSSAFKIICGWFSNHLENILGRSLGWKSIKPVLGGVFPAALRT